MRVIVFDTETTGLPKWVGSKYGSRKKVYPQVIQLGWLVYDFSAEKLVKSRDVIIKLPDGARIPPESTKIHKITNEMMDTTGVSLSDAFYEFNDDLQNCDVVIAHNLEFDKNVMMQEYERNGYVNVFDVMKKHEEYCTMLNTIDFCAIKKMGRYGLYNKWPKLEELHTKQFGDCPKGNLHDALNDVIVCFRAYCMYELGRDIVRDNVEYGKLFQTHFPEYDIDCESSERE